MSLFNRFIKGSAITALALSTFLIPFSNGYASSNSDSANGDDNGDGNSQVKFEYSPEDRYIVTFKNQTGMRTLNTSNVEVKAQYEIIKNTVVLEMDEKAVDELANDPNVKSIEKDEIVEHAASYSPPFQANDFVIRQTGAERAYYEGYSGQGVKVAVVDSGVDRNNPMLTHAIKGGVSLADWTNGSGDYQDRTGHGTAVAGALAGKYNGKPYGVAPDVDLYAVLATISDTEGSAWKSDLERGIEWAINNGMNAVNVSFQPSYVSERISQLANAASSNNMLIVYAAGNDDASRDVGDTLCRLYGIKCIGSINKDDTISSFSAYGLNNVYGYTYGSSVPVVNLGYHHPTIASGTSFAAPNFAGLYALYYSRERAYYWSQTPNVNELLLKMQLVSQKPPYDPNSKGWGEIGIARFY